MSLRADGFRFLVSKDRKFAKWIHPLEFINEWVDCTDMNDKDFCEFMRFVNETHS